MKYLDIADQMAHGEALYRTSWNDQSRFVKVEPGHNSAYYGTNITDDALYFVNKDDEYVPYVPSPEDLAADDWEVMGKPKVEKPVVKKFTPPPAKKVVKPVKVEDKK